MLPARDTREFSELLHEEVEKRRTFAIISHPDAGKTEKRPLSSNGTDRRGENGGRKLKQRGKLFAA